MSVHEGGEPRGTSANRTRRRSVHRVRRASEAQVALGTSHDIKAARNIREAAHTQSRSHPSIAIRPLKDLVVSAFPEGHALRTVILAEKDTLAPLELLAKMEVWLVLLNRGA